MKDTAAATVLLVLIEIRVHLHVCNQPFMVLYLHMQLVIVVAFLIAERFLTAENILPGHKIAIGILVIVMDGIMSAPYTVHMAGMRIEPIVIIMDGEVEIHLQV